LTNFDEVLDRIDELEERLDVLDDRVESIMDELGLVKEQTTDQNLLKLLRYIVYEKGEQREPFREKVVAR
jgi:uncharacterized Rmd1/YagE family protein